MTKYIRRIGIIFFALALSVLLIVGSLIAVNTTTNIASDIVNDQNNILSNNEKATDFVDLSGDSSTMATNWNTIITNAKTSGKANIRLASSWTATPNAEKTNTYFGEFADTFFHGALLIPEGMHITIDLNGKTFNRNKTSEGTSGYVFYVLGKLTITDNSYTNEDLLKHYKAYESGNVESQIKRLKTLPIGKITGGWTLESGGAIMLAGTSSEVVIDNGMIYGNKSEKFGGAVFIQSNNKFTMNGGIIMDNYADTSGGGIFAMKDTEITINGGIMLGNTAYTYNGGAVYGEEMNILINDTIMACNFAGDNGASICLIGGELNMYDGLLTRNTAQSHAGGIYVCNKNYGTDNNVDVTCNIYGGEISYNHGCSYAAALLLYYGAKCYIKDVNMHHNSVIENAGAIAVYWESTLVMDGGIISDNVVEYHTNQNHGGGGVLVGKGSTFIMNGGKIINNKVLNPWDSEVQGGGLLLANIGPNTVTLNKGEISGNYCEGTGGGIGDATTTNDSTINIGSSMQIINNKSFDESSDIHLKKGKKINLTSTLTNDSKIGIRLAEDYDSDIFTTNFSAIGNTNASDYFYSNNGVKIATINNGEVSFENSIESEIYDFIYLENGKRKNYKDNNLIHIVNDEQIKKQVNGGKLILGNILPNTSVNTFIQNINFDRTKVKLYDSSNNKLIYDKGNSVSGVDSSLYDSRFELAVGTGWRLETYTASGAKIEEFSLSVLGDSNGDGKISASDIIYIREIASDINLYDNLDVEFKLASLILNQGVVTSADSEIILNVIDKKLAISMFY